MLRKDMNDVFVVFTSCVLQSGSLCTYNPVGPGLNAERNIYAFSNYIVEIVTMFVIGI